MDALALETTLKFHLAAIRERLDKAAAIARAAEACAAAASMTNAIDVSHNIEQLAYDGSGLLNSASPLH